MNESRSSPSDGSNKSAAIHLRGDPLYDENPLVRHIPEIARSVEEHAEKTKFRPTPPSDTHRVNSLRWRLRATNVIPRLHIPLNRNFEAALLLEDLICEGYIDRAPNARYWERHHSDLTSFLESFKSPGKSSLAERIEARFGIPGVGKSIAIRKNLELIPQVIVHEPPSNPNASFKQVVWIRIECPPKRTPGSIAKKIIAAIGTAVGEDYSKTFCGGDSDDVIVAAGALVRLLFVGLIVIDDVQNAVSRAKNPRTDIIDLLVELSNELGVPMLFVGTHKAIALLARQMRSARKLLGDTWDIYSIDDPEWNRLLDAIWDYQWNRTFTPLTAKLRKRIYELTQGVPAFLIRLFYFAQRRAILLGDKEELTIEVFDEAFDQNFGSVHGIIRAIASGDKSLLDLYDDLPKDFSLESLLAKEAEEFRATESIAMRKRVHRAGLKASRLAEKRIAFETAMATPSRDGVFSSPANRIAKEAIEAGKDPFEALVEAGFLDKGLRK